jgi:hypothetical protein
MSWVQVVVFVFGVFMIGFSVFWLRFSFATRRSGEVIGANARSVVTTRIGTYLALGVCAVLLAITTSPWFAWIGIAAIVTKLLVEGYFRRRERRSTSANTRTP